VCGFVLVRLFVFFVVFCCIFLLLFWALLVSSVSVSYAPFRWGSFFLLRVFFFLFFAGCFCFFFFQIEIGPRPPANCVSCRTLLSLNTPLSSLILILRKCSADILVSGNGGTWITDYTWAQDGRDMGQARTKYRLHRKTLLLVVTKTRRTVISATGARRGHLLFTNSLDAYYRTTTKRTARSVLQFVDH